MSFKDKKDKLGNSLNKTVRDGKEKLNELGNEYQADSELKIALKKVGKVLLTVLMAGIIFCCIAGCIVTVWVFDALNNDQQLLDLDAQKLKYTTIFYADDGVTELARAYDPSEGNRIWADYDEMPQQLLNCVVAVEDKRFWEHSGVDFLTTTKAGLNAILQKLGLSGLYGGTTPGASTITQQVVRNITGDKEVSSARKLREIFRALNLEKYYTKEQIIETYLNLAGFSQNCSGIQSAAHVFFNKDVSELTVAECATIVGTTKNPTQYDPYSNFEANQERKEYILGLMYDQGKLNKQEYEEAMAQEIVLSYSENSNATIQNWFMDYATEQVCKDLAEKYGYTAQEAYSQLISGGYRIFTTCDPDVQNILEDVYSSLDNFPPVLNAEYPESAFVITDLGGAVKGIIGSNRPKEGNRVWNRAADTTRQPGSTIKPISSYSLAFENDIITYSTVIEDRQVVINPDEVSYSQELWTPKNFYAGFKGFVTVQYAIMRSINTIPVQLTQKMGTTASYNFMKYTLNIDSLVEGDDSYSPMALGSLTNGVTPVKMAGAYQMFGNGGTRTEPYSYTKVVDSYGNVVLETNTVPVRVISAETATIMNKLLQTVTTSNGTGATANLGTVPVAGKTGTTDDDVDQWFIGVTPYYVGVCWLGFDSRYQTDDAGNIIYSNGQAVPNSIRYSGGLGYPPPVLWKTVMSRVHEGLSGKTFDVSSNVVELSYCTDTGMIAGPGCTNTAIGWYKQSNIPQTCTYHNGGGFSNIPIVGSTASACGITYADQYLTDASNLIKAFNANAKSGNQLSVREAVEMTRAGISSWAAFLSSPYYSQYANRLKTTGVTTG